MTIRAIGYTRVSTNEQATSGLGLEAQQAAITDKTTREGWELVEVVTEPGGASSATLDRPGLTRALATVESTTADVLIVAKLDRLSRSIVQGGQVIDRARRRGWQLVALDLGLDMTSPAGEMVAGCILAASQYERRMIGVRTRAALQAKKAQGHKLGRPQQYPDTLIARVVQLREHGATLQAIADTLNTEGIPTVKGRPWNYGTVARLLKSEAAQHRPPADPDPTGWPTTPAYTPDIVARIVTARTNGQSFAKIAAHLNADRTPTVKGRPWTASAVYALDGGSMARTIRGDGRP
ncbi:recombinase family protein [Brevibacterium sp. 91QC2O2]|uniref:recombinase family protein n=1 Tax=Brevibacterium sp. 91QC2O2 TaxID=2968458 RepID=UPI00211C5FAA|nr:recombinase family protein [Brevibacterium sp. 91QC2O2]MCQ9367302.1 recombinase family protein [Brevibacterium sp. 91QC2O2]